MNNNGINLSEEYRDLVRYFRLSMLRDRGMLPPEGLKELQEIVNRNERAAAVEAAWKEHEEGRLSDENFQLVHDTHRAALAEAIKNASQNEVVEQDKPELSPEFADLARYFRLSILRNKGQLPPEGLKELEEIIARSERAQAIEETRAHLLDGSIKPEDYERVVASHRAALAEEIKKTFGRVNNEPAHDKIVVPEEIMNWRERIPATEEQARELRRINEEIEKNPKETQNEPEVDYKREGEEQAKQLFEKELKEEVKKELPDTNKNVDISKNYQKPEDNFVPELYGQIFARQLPPNDINEYDKVADNNHKEPIENPEVNQVPNISLADLNNNIEKEKINKIRETIEKNLNNKVEPFKNQEVPETDNKKLLSDLRKAINDIQKDEKITPQTTMFEERQQNSVDISDEYRGLARYFRLSILRNNGQLPPAGIEELNQIVAQNERAAAVEEARKQMEAGNLSKENYQKVHDVQRAALAEAIINAGQAPEKEQGRSR